MASLAVLALIFAATRSLLHETSYARVKAALSETPRISLLIAAGLTLVSFAGLIVYDVTGLVYIGRPLPHRVTSLTAFCAYAVSNIAGFGPLTGGAIRYKFYNRAGVEPEQVARLIAFLAIAYGVCLAGVGSLGFLLAADDLRTLLPFDPTILQVFSVATLLGLGWMYVAAGSPKPRRIGRFTMRLPSRRIIAQQSFATLIDVGAAAAVLWVLLPGNAIGLPAFIAIYSVAVGLGILSHVPGGLGVFETVVIGVASRQIPVEQVVGAIVLYRLIYFVFPLMLAGLIGAVMAMRHSTLELQFVPSVTAGLTFLMGAMLIFSSAVPTGPEALELLSRYMPEIAVEFAHFASGMVGLALLVMAGGLADRMRRAWRWATPLTLLALILAFAKGIAFGEAAVLAFLFVILMLARSEFTRVDRLGEIGANWAMAIASVVVASVALLVFAYPDSMVSERLLSRFELLQEGSRGLRAIVAVVLSASVILGWRLLRHPPAEPQDD